MADPDEPPSYLGTQAIELVYWGIHTWISQVTKPSAIIAAFYPLFINLL